MPNAKLLIVDDDAEICQLLQQFLEKYDFDVRTAANGEEMFAILKAESVQLIILDLMLPGEDGLTLCRKLMAHHTIPVLMLSAAAEETDRIVGLEVGADDYLPKPFNPRELLARVKAILRRYQHQTPEDPNRKTVLRYRFANWMVNADTRQVFSPEGAEISLSSGEYDLLLIFLKHPHKVLSRDQLLEHTRHREHAPFDRSIDMQISRLRQKMEINAKEPLLIKTVRGGGYVFAATVSKIDEVA